MVHLPSRFRTIDQLLDEARRTFVRMAPAEALEAQHAGSALVDMRSEIQRLTDGEIPGTFRYPRNVLEWRLDPACEYRDARIARRDILVMLICDEGYQSSLAAANIKEFGLRVTDVIGGFRAWRAAGLPIEPPGSSFQA